MILRRHIQATGFTFRAVPVAIELRRLVPRETRFHVSLDGLWLDVHAFGLKLSVYRCWS